MGEDGHPGAVRTIAGRIVEVMVSNTDLSYTYTYAQPPAPDQYHGSLEVVPVTATTSEIRYMIFRDQSSLADQAARCRGGSQADHLSKVRRRPPRAIVCAGFPRRMS